MSIPADCAMRSLNKPAALITTLAVTDEIPSSSLMPTLLTAAFSFNTDDPGIKDKFRAVFFCPTVKTPQQIIRINNTVDGESSAATACTLGSNRLMSSRPIICSPPTPFLSPWRYSLSTSLDSASSAATISLPVFYI